VPVGPSKDAPDAEPEVTPPFDTRGYRPRTEKQRLGHIELAVLDAKLDRVVFEGLTGRPDESASQYVIVNISLSNLSSTVKTQYDSWGGRVFGKGDPAVLRDEYGNVYKRITADGFDAKVPGAIDNASIYPEKTVTDVLIFERPIERATRLYMYLPGDNVGQEGAFKILLKKQPPPQPPPPPPPPAPWPERFDQSDKAQADRRSKLERWERAGTVVRAPSRMGSVVALRVSDDFDSLDLAVQTEIAYTVYGMFFDGTRDQDVVRIYRRTSSILIAECGRPSMGLKRVPQKNR
jgi:hypothetical protein